MSLLPILTSGCTTTTPTDTFCAAAFPIYLDDDEYLNDQNSKKLKAQDLYGIKHCNWKY